MTMGAMHAFKREKSKHDGGKVMDVDEQLSHLFFFLVTKSFESGKTTMAMGLWALIFHTGS